MQAAQSWKLLDFSFLSLRSKPLEEPPQQEVFRSCNRQLSA